MFQKGDRGDGRFYLAYISLSSKANLHLAKVQHPAISRKLLSAVTKTVITLVNNYKTFYVIHIPYNGLVMQYVIQQTALSVLNSR